MIPFSVFSVDDRLLKLMNNAFKYDDCVGELTIERTNDGVIDFYTDLSTEHTFGAFFPSETIKEAETLAKQGVMIIDADKIFESMELEYQEMIIKDVVEGIDDSLLFYEITGRIWLWLDDPTFFDFVPLKLYCPHIPVKLLSENT